MKSSLVIFQTILFIALALFYFVLFFIFQVLFFSLCLQDNIVNF